MKVINTDAIDVKTIETDHYRGCRGCFVGIYNAECYKNAGITADSFLDNESFSMKCEVRGLYWQVAPHTQAKFVRVILEAVRVGIAVDIRTNIPPTASTSPTASASSTPSLWHLILGRRSPCRLKRRFLPPSPSTSPSCFDRFSCLTSNSSSSETSSFPRTTHYSVANATSSTVSPPIAVCASKIPPSTSLGSCRPAADVRRRIGNIRF